MMLANIANALSVLLVLWFENQFRLDAVCWAMIVISMAGWVMFRHASRRNKPFPEKLSSRTYRRSVIQAAFLGALRPQGRVERVDLRVEEAAGIENLKRKRKGEE